MYRKANELCVATLTLIDMANEQLSLMAAHRNVRQVFPPGCRPTHHPFGTESCLDMNIFKVVERKLLESPEAPGETYWPDYVDPQDISASIWGQAAVPRDSCFSDHSDHAHCVLADLHFRVDHAG